MFLVVIHPECLGFGTALAAQDQSHLIYYSLLLIPRSFKYKFSLMVQSRDWLSGRLP